MDRVAAAAVVVVVVVDICWSEHERALGVERRDLEGGLQKEEVELI